LKPNNRKGGQRILTEGEAAVKADEVGEIRMAVDALERWGRPTDER
jgi:hypothetical protein